MLSAAKEEIVPLLAALPLSRNSHPGHQLPTVLLYPATGFTNSNTTTALAASLYDESRSSQSTGQERDGELVPNADFFNARYFMGVLGNFTSPDPGNAGADLYHPQSWNAYAYVLGNPLGSVDPSGMSLCPTSTPGSIVCVQNDPTPASGNPDFATSTLPYSFINDWISFLNYALMQLSGGGGGGGGAVGNRATVTSTPLSAPSKTGNVFSCASEAAANVSIAGALQRFGIGTSGVGGFATNALGGNAFSGLTDLVQSFGSGEAGGHNVFYNMGQGVAAGPTQGFGAAFGKSIEGTPWGSGPVDVASTALAAGGMRVITGAGRTIQTINGAVRLGTVLGEGAEYGSGIGEAKLAYDAVSYFGAWVGCATGVIH